MGPFSINGYGPKTVLAGLWVMADPNEPIHIETDDARAGSTPHMTRYILAISLVLVIVIFGFLVLR
ncbi:hypothetical protein SAMN05428984_2960 [Sphingomonas sp. OK281]|nr:hypothetical protein SAMN05428984_2960 [Sphingomonas sp. OK281]